MAQLFSHDMPQHRNNKFPRVCKVTHECLCKRLCEIGALTTIRDGMVGEESRVMLMTCIVTLHQIRAKDV